MDGILIILKKENGPRASSAPALGSNTIIFKRVYWYMQQISGERLQDHWSSGYLWLFQTSLDEVNISKMRPRVVELSVNLAMDRKASHRELTSVLISDLYGKAISAKDIQMGFDSLLNNLKDITIDSPEAPKVR